MAIRGITFSKQMVSSNDDSHIYEVLLNGRTGRTKGCKMTFGSDVIHISEGYFFASNRLIEISSTETVSTPSTTSGTTYCRLVFEIDFSKTNTNEEFNQGSFKILTSSSNYPEITQEDLADVGNIYQMPFARFTKTINGISSFVSELETIGYVKNEKTIYVSTSGNDASGDGSEGYPFGTIQHAIDCAPKDLAGEEITINIASGTYAEDLIISGFSGGSIRLTFGAVTINSITFYETRAIMSGTSLAITASGKTYGFHCHRDSNIICQIPLTITGSTYGLFVGYGSKFAGRSKITINSCTFAVTSTYSALLYALELGGSKNNNGVQAAAGIAMIGTIAAAMASTLYATTVGGRIYTGAQASVPTY